MKTGDKVQVWSDTEKKCLGWGMIVAIGKSQRMGEEIPLIKLVNEF